MNDKTTGLSERMVPTALTAELLAEILCLSPKVRRELGARLHRARPDAWPRKIREKCEFYERLYALLISSGGRKIYTPCAIAVEKRKKPLSLGPAFFRWIVEKNEFSDELIGLLGQSEPRERPLKVLKWLIDQDSVDDASLLAWALAPEFEEEVDEIFLYAKEKEVKLAFSESGGGSVIEQPVKSAEPEPDKSDEPGPAKHGISQRWVEQLQEIQALVQCMSNSPFSLEEAIKLHDASGNLVRIASQDDADRKDKLKALLEKVVSIAASSSIATDVFDIKQFDSNMLEKVHSLKDEISEATQDFQEKQNLWCSAKTRLTEAAGPTEEESATEVLQQVIAARKESQTRFQSVVAKLINIAQGDDRLTEEQNDAPPSNLVQQGDGRPGRMLVSNDGFQSLHSVNEPEPDVDSPAEKSPDSAAQAQAQDRRVSGERTPVVAEEISNEVESSGVFDSISAIRKNSGAQTRSKKLPCGEQSLLELVGAGKFAESYWLQLAYYNQGQPTIVRPVFLALAAAVRQVQAFGVESDPIHLERAVDDKGSYREFLEEIVELDDVASQECLLLSVSILPLALFLREKPAELFQLASSLRLGLPKYDSKFEAWLEAFVYRGLTVDATDLAHLTDRFIGRDLLEQVSRKAEEFIEQIPRFTINFRPAAELFATALRDGQMLRKMLEVVARNNLSRRSWLERELGKFDSEELLDELVAAKIVNGKPLGKVQGVARTKLLNRFEQAAGIAAEWLQITAANQSQADTDREDKKKLLQDLAQSLPLIAESYAGASETDANLVALGGAVKHQVRWLVDCLKGESSGKESSLAIAVCAAPDVRLDKDLHPLDSEDNWVALIDALSTTDKLSTAELVKKLLENGEYLRAEIVSSSTENPAIRQEVTSAVIKGKEGLIRDCADLENQVEEAYLLGLLQIDPSVESSEDGPRYSRTSLIADLQYSKQVLENAVEPTSVEVFQAKCIIDEVRGVVEARRNARVAELRQEIETLAQSLESSELAGSDEASYLRDRAQRYQEKSDIIALAELVSRARDAVADNRELVRADLFEAKIAIRQDYVKKAAALRGSWTKAHRIAKSIRDGKTIEGIAFGDKDLAYRESAANAALSWSKLVSRGSFSSIDKKLLSAIKDILRFLGVVEIQGIEPVSEQDDLLLLRADSLSVNARAPVPAFGSEIMHGAGILVVRVKKTPREMADFIAKARFAKMPVFLLYLPESSEKSRLDFRRQIIKKHQSAVLIDFALFLFCAGSRDPYPTLLNVALPYSWSQPYLMQGERVPREMFVGRDKEVQTLLDPDGSCVVYGGRQLGKSALLRHLQVEHHDPGAGIYIVYRDVDDLGNPPQIHADMEKDVWSRISQELARVGFFEEQSLPRRNRREYSSAVRECIRKRLDESPGDRLIVLLDEADDLIGMDAGEDFRLVKQLRALMVETNRRFKIVFAGLQSIQRFKNYPNHAFAQLGSDIVISPLPAKSAQELVQAPMAALGFQFEYGGLVLRMLSQANYHPGLVQIFCYRLLEHMYRHQSASSTEQPCIIRRQDVSAVERNPEFMEDIRNRFDWTLDLDDRYKALTYALVLTNDPTSQRTEEEFLELGRSWWFAVFSEMDNQGIRALLEEMVGLGVLLREQYDGSRMYRLRSPNLLRLLGPKSEIESELEGLITRQKVRKSNPRNYRKLIQEKPPTFAPLTMEQEAQLLVFEQQLRIVMVQGNSALGIDQLGEEVRALLKELGESEGSNWREINFSEPQIVGGAERVSEKLLAALKNKERENKFVLLRSEALALDGRPQQFISRLAFKLESLSKHKSKSLIVVAMSDSDVWDWVRNQGQVAGQLPSPVSVMRLRRWSDGALAKAMEDVGLRSRAKDNGELVFKFTKGLHGLSQAVIRTLKAEAVKTLTSDGLSNLVDSISGSEPHSKVTISNPLLRSATRKLVELSDENGALPWDTAIEMLIEEEGEDGKLVGPILSDSGEALREWLQIMGIASPAEKSANTLYLFDCVE